MARQAAILLVLSALVSVSKALHPDMAVRVCQLLVVRVNLTVIVYRYCKCERANWRSHLGLLMTKVLYMHGVQASISETSIQRRRRLKVEAILPTDPGQDGIAVGLDGKIYSDTAITDAVARVGELGPLNPKVAVCHFPPQERAQFQVIRTADLAAAPFYFCTSVARLMESHHEEGIP